MMVTQWPDLWIARLMLIHYLEDGELYVADGGCNDGYQWAETPTGYYSHEQRTNAFTWACHQVLWMPANDIQAPIASACNHVPCHSKLYPLIV